MAKTHILVVEDEGIVVRYLQESLISLGYVVSAVSFTGEEAFNKAVQIHPDLVLMDIDLKGEMDGIQTAEKIRARLDIPVIYLTAHSDVDTLERAKITEPFGYVIKPFKLRELSIAIEIALYKHRMEKSLRENEEKYLMLIENTDDIVFSLTSEGVITFISSQIQRYGFNPNEIISRHYLEFVFPEDREKVSHYMTKTILNSENIHVEFRIEDKEERIIWVKGIGKVVRDKSGKIIAETGILSDITERKKIENTLMLLKEAIEALPIGITFSDINGKILYTNPAEAEMHGYTVEELIGQDARIFAPEEMRNPKITDKSTYSRVLRRETVNIRKSGGLFPVQLTSINVKDASGSTIGVVYSCEDITNRKKAEEEIIKRQEALHSVYKMATTLGSSFKKVCDEIVSDLSLLLRSSHILVLCYRATMVEVISVAVDGKLTTQEINYLPFLQSAGPFHKKEVYQYKGSLCDWSKSYPFAERLKSLVYVPGIDAAGNVVGAIIAMDCEDRDYSDREIQLIEIFAQYVAFQMQRDEMETKLIEAQKNEAIGKLAIGFAHEVRNPLNTIMLFTETIAKNLRKDPKYNQLIFHIRSQIDRLSALMKDLLNLGKPIDQSNLYRQSLNMICSASVDAWKHSNISRSHTVKIIRPSDVSDIFVVADSQKLQQVFINLLENAAQHSPEGSEIQITIYPPEGNVCRVQVVDRSSGVSEEIMPKIFEPFFSTRRGGTGLGLSIVKNIIETHDGRVMLFNNQPPPGCTVEVRLPTSDESDQ